MSDYFCSSRGFSLAKDFFQKNEKNLEKISDKNSSLSVFDNNRFASRKRVFILKLDSLNIKLFDIELTITYEAMVHCSNNVVILANMSSKTPLDKNQINRVISNWIPKENIFTLENKELNIRNILNYGFFLFLSALENKKVSFNDFTNLKSLEKYKYEDIDIQEIERVYNSFSIDNSTFFFIPSMYGTSFIIKDKSFDDLEAFEIKETKIHLQRNSAYIYESAKARTYVYVISFFNLIKHMKNRMGFEVSSMLDDINSLSKSDYSKLLDKSLELKKEVTLNYDEFNNINIWHDEYMSDLSKYIRTSEAWNIENELSENKNKLSELVELTTEMSKGKFQSFMDSISLLIGILGIFAIFDLIQVLNSDPYTGIPWIISFIFILICLPIFLIVMAKKSSSFINILNKFL